MTMTNFKGAAKPLDKIDIPVRAFQINVTEDHLRAFMEVEARSRGFDREGRPVMLYEPHVFYRNCKDPKKLDEAIKSGVAYQKWGTKPYPSDSYSRLAVAVQIDEHAALKACSIGMSQVLVENHASLGYSTPQEMWQKFMDDEEEHVEAMVRFIIVNGIDDDIRHERWDTAARIYNGPGYLKNDYPNKLRRAFAKFKGIPDVDWKPAGPDVVPMMSGDELKPIQRRLRELGYPEVGKADGAWGTKFRAAVLAFRADNGLPLYAGIDDEFLAALMGDNKREIGEGRATVTVEKLKEEGSRVVKGTDKAEKGGVAVGVVGVLGTIATTFGFDEMDSVQGFITQAGPLVDTLKTLSLPALGLLGAFIAYQAWKAKQARVEDHRSGVHQGSA